MAHKNKSIKINHFSAYNRAEFSNKHLNLNVLYRLLTTGVLSFDFVNHLLY